MPSRTGATVVLLTLAYTVARLAGQAPAYNLLIRNGRVVDGTGSPWFSADVAVRADMIAAVGPQLDGTAARIIDARNAVVSPGFIDLHVHAFGTAGPPPDPMPIVELPTADNYIRQGVTTLISGPDRGRVPPSVDTCQRPESIDGNGRTYTSKRPDSAE